ncbi:MAG: tRNA lysidine(34) synthetase TilS, partial [Bacteroidota bacterium]
MPKSERLDVSLSSITAKFIEINHLLSKGEKIVVGVSGGRDSMALLHYLHHSGYVCIACHVNYGLRPESTSEEVLVADYCNENQIQFEALRLSLSRIARLKTGNLQANAREVRYQFFENVRSHYEGNAICTAHHRNDRNETFLINAMRGSGLNGLTSLSMKQGWIRRPLLLVS